MHMSKGWHFESMRHSLARKGIKTGRKQRVKRTFEVSDSQRKQNLRKALVAEYSELLRDTEWDDPQDRKTGIRIVRDMEEAKRANLAGLRRITKRDFGHDDRTIDEIERGG